MAVIIRPRGAGDLDSAMRAESERAGVWLAKGVKGESGETDSAGRAVFEDLEVVKLNRFIVDDERERACRSLKKVPMVGAEVAT